MKNLTIHIFVVISFFSNKDFGQVQTNAINPETIVSVKLKEKEINGKKVKSINSKELKDGYYKLDLTDNLFLQFKVLTKKVKSIYNQEGIKYLASKSSSGYECDESICTCDWNKEDCSEMLEDCYLIIDLDGIAICVKNASQKGPIKSFGGSKINLLKLSKLGISQSELDRIHQDIQNQLRKIGPSVKCTNISGNCLNSIEASCFQLACMADELNCDGDYSSGPCKEIKNLHEAGLCGDLARSECGQNLPLIVSNNQTQLNKIIVKATIEKVYCRSAYDGNNDNVEEVYGLIDVSPGQMCYDGDTERHSAQIISGTGRWELKPNNFKKMRQGETLNINKTLTWQYIFPSKCGLNEYQTIAQLRSNLDERDLPNDADDLLENGCAGCKLNHYCEDVVFLTKVINPGTKTFKFTQIHSSGGTNLEVYYKIVINSIASNDIGTQTK